jgi:Tol biopolymer transport system component
MITNCRLAVAITAIALSVVILPPAPAQADTGGRRLVYLDHGWAYRATAADPTHRHRLVRPRHSIVEEVAVSPDGSRVAELLQIDHLGGRLEHRLVVAGAGGRHRHKVFSTDSSFLHVTGFGWSPNSKRLYFGKSSQRECGVAPREWLTMARIHADGRVDRSRVPGGAGRTSPTVSPGGGKLAAVRTTWDDRCFATSSSLVKLRLRDGHVSAPLVTVTNTQFALASPAWSPDNALIAVVKQNPCCTGDGESSDIDVVAADGSSNGIPMVAATGNTFLLRHPAWKRTSQLWYSRSFESEEDRTPSQPGNLYSVHLSESGDSFKPPVRRTTTPHRSEMNPSFGLRP